MPQLDDLFVLQRPSSGSHHKFSWGDLLIDANNSVASEYGVHVGETPPPDPHEGDLWYQPSTEEFKIYLVDMTTGAVNDVEIRNGGSGYAVAQNLPTTSGSGHELFIDITSVDGTGKITSIAVSQDGTGHGYAINDVVFLFNNGHGNGSVIIKSVTSLANGTWKVIDGAAGAGELWTESGGALYPTTTTNNVGIGGTLPATPNISLNANGSATFAGDVLCGKDASGFGVSITNNAVVQNNSINGAGFVLGQAAVIPAVATGAPDTNGSISLGTATNPWGSATFAGAVQRGGNPYQGGGEGVALEAPGKIMVCRESGTTFENYTKGNASPTVLFDASGNATFAGNVAAAQSGTTAAAVLNKIGTLYVNQPTANNTASTPGLRISGNNIPNAQIWTDGSAKFAGKVTAQSFDIDSLPPLDTAP